MRVWREIAVAASLVLAGAAGCGRGGEAAGDRRAAASAPRTIEPGRLEPGRYRAQLTPPFSFAVGPGWEAPAEAPPPGVVVINKKLGRGFLELFALRADEIYDGRDPEPATPDDLAAALRESPLLDADAPEDVTIGDVRGRRVDARSRVRSALGQELLGASSAGFCCKNVEMGAHYRFVVLENGVTLIVAALERAAWAEATAAAGPVLRSVDFS